MSKNSGFLSFIDELKSELNDIKAQLNEEHESYNGNVLRASTKPKNKKNQNKSKKNNYKQKSYGSFESSEGKSIMTSSMEGQGLEGHSIEGNSMMTESMEGRSQMYSSHKMENTNSIKESHNLEKLIKKKNDKLGLKDRENLLRAVVYSEIIGKPKSLK